MTTKLSTGAVLALLVCGLMIGFAPAAFAQLDTVDAVLNPDGGSANSQESGDGGDSSSSGTILDEAVGGVTDAVDQTVGGGETGPAGEDPVPSITDQVTDLLTDPDGTVEETVQDPGGKTKELTGGVTNAVAGSTESSSGPSKSNGSPAGRHDSNKKDSRADKASESEALVFGGALTDSSQRDPKTNLGPIAAVSDEVAAPRPDVIQQIGRVFAEAAEQAAFPAVLTALVIGFLMLQSRIDRRDPKLAMAPVDAEHEHLSFS